MPMAEPVPLFCSRITSRRFDDQTLGILESLMLCKDVKSLMELRTTLTEFMRSQSVSVLLEITEKTIQQKLWILEFFVRAFALIGDIESCLALKYEALLLREIKSSSCQSLKVSYTEWIIFAEQLIQNGLHSTARQACEHAMVCLRKDDAVVAKTGQLSSDKRIQRLKECAVKFAASGSVQAQATKYFKRKSVEKSKICSSFGNEEKLMASTLFRNRIRKRNLRQFHESQCRLPKN